MACEKTFVVIISTPWEDWDTDDKAAEWLDQVIRQNESGVTVTVEEIHSIIK